MIDPGGKGIRVVRRHARKGEHVAVARIEHDRGAVEAGRLVAVLDRLLQVVVDGELQPLAFGRRLLFERLDLAAHAVDDDAARAVLAHQLRVVDPLDARLADDVAALQAGVFRDLRVVHLADVPK